MTCAELLAWGSRELARFSPEPRLDATRLLEHVLHATLAQILAYDTESVSEEAEARFSMLLKRRIAGEPIAYLCGEAWFYGRRFEVDARVLVPRPETELLIEIVLDALRVRSQAVRPRIADVGTGSGAIAITLALECAQAEVVAVDYSSEALEMMRRNCLTYGLAHRIDVRQSDLLDALVGNSPFDIVAANLPYLRSDELPVFPDPTAFEPRLALDGGDDGIALYRRMFRRLAEVLAPGALVVLEAAPPTMAELAASAAEQFPEASITVVCDYGGAERMLVVQF